MFNTSDPPDLEHGLALAAAAATEPIRDHDGRDGGADRDRDRRELHRFDFLVDLAAQLPQLRFDVVEIRPVMSGGAL